ncbi:hypothetical protein CAPTEDRAFT_221558 [Capitella teleta]|uniref:Equilibrative nucleoside transporter 4 n=1 Tax=Capitella teleta TaxID=283909 RepID=R7V9M4_CAPTE|nr:hypothetical protein CAPTEDRAFT_221558 [Capitella teleta]|eukprot:ELU15279.1 hypothetical protein CAPTEDRAFT_221558 [Capitella teleta]
MDENASRGFCHGGRSAIRTTSSPPAADRCSAVYLGMLLCGAGFLLPYNSFITAVDYYQGKYPGSTIIFDMSFTYICTAFVALLVNNILVETFSLNVRISFGYVTALVMLCLVTIFDVSLEMFSSDVSYFVTLAAVSLIALGCTVQQSSFYGYTSMLPKRYTQAVMTGESAAGVIVSVNRILTKSFLSDPRRNTVIFFGVSIASVVLCCIIFHATRHTTFVRYHVGVCRTAALDEDARAITHQVCNPEEVGLVEILDGTVTRDHYGVLVLQSPSSPGPDTPAIPGGRDRSGPEQIARAHETQLKFKGHSYKRHISRWDSLKNGVRRRWAVAKGVWPFMLSIGLAYFVTLCLFPGIESEIVSCHWASWMPILLISIFNFSDFCGKVLASIPYEWPRGRLVFFSCLRIVLVPLMMLCAAPRSSPILKGETWAMLLSMLLGLTNGYFGSIPMILAPSTVPDEQKELTGNIMTLSYGLGLTLGSGVAYLLNLWLGPHLTIDPCLPSNSTTLFANISADIYLLPGHPPGNTSIY